MKRACCVSGEHYALADLYAGFTTLQDMGSPFTYATVELRDAINKGVIPGPRLQVAGPQIDPRGATYYPAPSEVGAFGAGPGSASLAAFAERELPRHCARGLYGNIRTTAPIGSRFMRPRTMKAADIRIPRARGHSRRMER